MTPRPVKCWAVVRPDGSVILSTVERTRRDALNLARDNFDLEWSTLHWRGYRVVRCVLSVEARDG